jgi:hypothetical protein
MFGVERFRLARPSDEARSFKFAAAFLESGAPRAGRPNFQATPLSFASPFAVHARKVLIENKREYHLEPVDF